MSSVDELRDVVAEAIVDRAIAVSQRLHALAVPHVLIGGLAVGLHGHPRATKDVDFMVGPQAFASTEPLLVYREELRELVAIGFTDIMSVPPSFPVLESELSTLGEVPVISLPGLVLMKLDAFRPRDREDVRMLLQAHRERLREVRDHLTQYAPQLVNRLGEALAGR
jgi:hypothetical protein